MNNLVVTAELDYLNSSYASSGNTVPFPNCNHLHMVIDGDESCNNEDERPSEFDNIESFRTMKAAETLLEFSALMHRKSEKRTNDDSQQRNHYQLGNTRSHSTAGTHAEKRKAVAGACKKHRKAHAKCPLDCSDRMKKGKMLLRKSETNFLPL